MGINGMELRDLIRPFVFNRCDYMFGIGFPSEVIANKLDGKIFVVI
jgi:hypothetical protein